MTFGQATSALVTSDVAMALRREPTLLFAGGGVPIRSMGSILGGIGVSGSSTAQMDERCALAGASAIQVELEMRDP